MQRSMRKSAIIISLCLAKHYPVPVTVEHISEENRLSVSYLEQILAYFRKSNIAIGIRGPHGGYVLKASPSSVSILDVLKSIQNEPTEGYLDPKVGKAISKIDSEHNETHKRMTLSGLMS